MSTELTTPVKIEIPGIGTIESADLCLIMTEWKEILDYNLNNFKEKMNNPLILDGRNCYSLEDMKTVGVEYYSIGR